MPNIFETIGRWLGITKSQAEQIEEECNAGEVECMFGPNVPSCCHDALVEVRECLVKGNFVRGLTALGPLITMTGTAGASKATRDELIRTVSSKVLDQYFPAPSFEEVDKGGQAMMYECVFWRARKHENHHREKGEKELADTWMGLKDMAWKRLRGLQ